MLIDDIPSSVTYEYTGVHAFSVNFPFYGTESIRMGFRESAAPTLAPHTELTKDLDFAVTGVRAGVDDSEIAFITGEATLTGAGALKLSAGNIIVVYRDTPATQLYAYNEYDNFPAKSHENALGRGITIAQEQRERAERALTLPPGSGSGADVITAMLDAVDHAVEAADLAEQSAVLSTTEANRAAAEADRALAEANRAETAVDGAIDAIVAEGDAQHARVLAEGDLQYTRVSAAGDLETQRVTDAGDTQVERILDMGVTLSTKGLGALYGNGLTLQLTEPAAPTSVSVTASSTPSIRNFTYTAPDDDFLSPTALYDFACRVTGMDNRTFTFKAEYLLGATLISSGEVSVFGQSTLLLGVPMNANLLNEKLPYPAGTVLTVRLTITRSGSSSQNINLESSPLNPMTFTRNGGSVQASNVVDIFGGEQKTQAEINFILASTVGSPSASGVSFDPKLSGLMGSTVQEAMLEIYANAYKKGAFQAQYETSALTWSKGLTVTVTHNLNLTLKQQKNVIERIDLKMLVAKQGWSAGDIIKGASPVSSALAPLPLNIIHSVNSFDLSWPNAFNVRVKTGGTAQFGIDPVDATVIIKMWY